MLEVQDSGIVLFAWVTDPQGSDDLEGVRQTIGVYLNSACESSTIDATSDIHRSGRKESFGTVVRSDSDASLYAAISASSEWPVHVDLVDKHGHRTSGRVSARVVH